MMTRELLRTLLLVLAISRLGRVACAESTHGADQQQQQQQQSASSAMPSGLSGPDYTGPSAGSDECDPEMVGFELVTGYVYTAPTDTLDTIPGTVMITDCLEMCQTNDSCQAVNYETGLCVLFSSNADSNPDALSQPDLPVFPIYAQKSCLAVRPCERAWCIDRVQGHRLQGHTRRTMTASSRQHCLELCLGETDFLCRSANYVNATKQCDLSDMDRLTVAGSNAFQSAEGYDYLENHCVDEPVKLCEFKKITGRVLKTVDAVYQDVGTAEECRELCLNSPFRCHSYDYGGTGDMICRLSHHSRATLSDIQAPYVEKPYSSTYELSSCYNVTIDCRAGDMVTRIQTSKLFYGKVYVKGSPNSCVQDVKGALEFELRMAYDDLECNIRQQGLGRYLNDVVIQHHDTIVTSSDLGLAVTCQYDLTNKTVSNEVDLGVHGDITPALSEEVIVDSPNVAMKITDRDGNEGIPTAEVGDPLALKFEILDPNSPYEIFVRELVAMDGVDSSEIILIDADGCPTDHVIMGPLYKSATTGKILLSHFDAFKFPSSEVVQFRALVTPCMPTCEPVQCDQEQSTGEIRSVISFGRRRRRRSAVLSSQNREDLLLVQSIQIMDKFGFKPDNKASNASSAARNTVFVESEDISLSMGMCINLGEAIVAGTVFLVAQIAVIAAWAVIWQRRRQMLKHQDALSVSVSVPSMHSGPGRTDSLCKLYDTGYSARRF
ncbi:ZP and PAN domain-containing protein neyo [Halictus rubicundus]|uniref:ZP and PAN domain-containing protein neyo n=1 Tax=Halictus rubicundus TaxID=77578 RepID=UPI0040371C33